MQSLAHTRCDESNGVWLYHCEGCAIGFQLPDDLETHFSEEHPLSYCEECRSLYPTRKHLDLVSAFFKLV